MDDLLTYVTPTLRQTTLPVGTTATRVTIIYDPGIDANTFRASLESADVTGAFHAVPGSRETVTIPLFAGRNVLKLGVTGTAGSRTATDQDQLVFIVK